MTDDNRHLLPEGANPGEKPKYMGFRASSLDSSCPVKFWGAHFEAWQLAYLARSFAQFTPGFQLLPFRRGFLLIAAGPETSAKRG